MRRFRRPIQSSANRAATTGPFTDTRLISEGHSSYNFANATGPLLVSFDQHGSLVAVGHSVDTTTSNEASERIFRERFNMLEHVGLTPTIVTLDSNILSGQTSGIVRAWACATPDKRNGVWAEVESVTDRPTGPVRLLSGLAFINVNNWQPRTTSDDIDPGYQAAVEHFPAHQVQNGRYVFRPTRIRFGYVVDGAEVIQGDYWDPEGVYPFRWTIELAIDPLGLDEGKPFAGYTNFASVLFQAGKTISVSPPVTVFSEPEQYKFIFDAKAVGNSDLPLSNRQNLIEWLSPRATGPHVPVGVVHAQQKTAIDGGYSLCLPQMPTGPTGVKVVRPASIHRPATSCDEYFTWVGQSTENVPGPTYAAPLAIKNGPSWHGQSLIPIGTSSGIDYARHDLEFTFPTYLPSVIAGTTVAYSQQGSPAGFNATMNIALNRHLPVAVSGQTIALNSFIGDRQLLVNTFAINEVLPTLTVSGASTNANFFYPNGVPYVYEVDFVVNGSARIAIFRTTDQNPVFYETFSTTSPFSSLSAAKAAGLTDDEFWYLQTAAGRLQTLGKIDWQKTVINLRLHAAAKITVRQIGEISCNFIRYRRIEHSLAINLTPDQCRNLGNGQTVTPNVTNFVSPGDLVAFSDASGQLRLA